MKHIICYSGGHSSAQIYLEEMEGKFEQMKQAGIPATEHIPHQKFWGAANKFIKIAAQQAQLPCECIF